MLEGNKRGGSLSTRKTFLERQENSIGGEK